MCYSVLVAVTAESKTVSYMIRISRLVPHCRAAAGSDRMGRHQSSGKNAMDKALENFYDDAHDMENPAKAITEAIQEAMASGLMVQFSGHGHLVVVLLTWFDKDKNDLIQVEVERPSIGLALSDALAESLTNLGPSWGANDRGYLQQAIDRLNKCFASERDTPAPTR
jgi:hypothetical protein